jgi:Uma2 family endonuclease
MSIRAALITADDLLNMPDSGMRRELIQGELREMTPTGFEHGCVAGNFSGPLVGYVRDMKLGVVCVSEPGFILATDPDTVRAPDVAFVTRERVASLTNVVRYFPGAPDLAIEVISPNDAYSEVEEKVECWLEAGCRMVVVANPRNRTLKVYRSRAEISLLTIDDSFDGGEVVPGFSLPVRQIFLETCES